jgi:hypothetical protein
MTAKGERQRPKPLAVPRWSTSHELVANMRALYEILKDNPRGQIIARRWHIANKLHYIQPSRTLIENALEAYELDDPPHEPAEPGSPPEGDTDMGRTKVKPTKKKGPAPKQAPYSPGPYSPPPKMFPTGGEGNK